MKTLADPRAKDSIVAFESRRKFLRRALVMAAYVTPVVLSYPSTVFANHPCPADPGKMSSSGMPEMCAGLSYSPGCSRL
jgi:hypothetical protein